MYTDFDVCIFHLRRILKGVGNQHFEQENFRLPDLKLYQVNIYCDKTLVCVFKTPQQVECTINKACFLIALAILNLHHNATVNTINCYSQNLPTIKLRPNLMKQLKLHLSADLWLKHKQLMCPKLVYLCQKQLLSTTEHVTLQLAVPDHCCLIPLKNQ